MHIVTGVHVAYHMKWLRVNVKVHIASGYWKLQITTYQETNLCALMNAKCDL